MGLITSKHLGLVVMTALAGAWPVLADVLVRKDGTLLLGDVRVLSAEKVKVVLGSGVSTVISAADIQTNISCPPVENPDSYLKAAYRAQRAGYLPTALACYEKSIATEPATAAAAQTGLAHLRREMAAKAGTRLSNAPGNDADRRRAEAKRLIEEGEALLRGAHMAKSFDVAHRDSSAKDVRRVGEANAKAAEEKIAKGKAMLASLDPPKQPDQTGLAARIQSETGLDQDWLSQNWPWIVGSLLGVILLLRFVRRSFFG